MLRKTSGTLARKITGDVYAASKLLDHSSVSITEKYYQEELDENKVMVADALNGVLTVFVGEFGGNFSQKNGEKKNPVPQRPPEGSRPILTLVKSTHAPDRNRLPVGPLGRLQPGLTRLRLAPPFDSFW